MPALAAEVALPEPVSCRRQFDLAAASFASADFLYDEARRRLLERLDHLRVPAGPVVDAGAALGHGARLLGQRLPESTVLAFDRSRVMLRHAVDGRYARIAGDLERMPFRPRSISLLFANLVLPWTLPEALFGEARRVLAPDGLLLFSTLGPDSLQEVRRAWAAVDDRVHVHAFWDVQTLGDLALRAGLEEPVLDVDRIEISYASVAELVRDLRAMGATNTARGRRRTLTGPIRWRRFVAALSAERGGDRLGITVELILGQAFGSRRGPAGSTHGEVVVPMDQIGRR